MQTASSEVRDPSTIRAAWQALREAGPVRARDAAGRLGVSECELVATSCGARDAGLPSAIRLTGPWGQLIEALPRLGTVMALTRNASCVHEKTGRYDKVEISGRMGLVLDPDIDLRLFLDHWHHGFAVEEPGRQGARRSLQFFDQDGTAVHKVYLVEDSDAAMYDALVTLHRHADQSAAQTVSGPPVDTSAATRADVEIGVAALRADWATLRDTHSFFPMLRKHKVGRLQALRLVGGEFARAVPTRALRDTLQAAAAGDVEIMVFVGSPGCIQIHSGPVTRLVETAPWFNVLDPGFNLHLKEADIASAWVVQKPTVDGTVTSLELFDAAERNIALLFGARKPGKPERTDWRDLVAGIGSAAHA